MLQAMNNLRERHAAVVASGRRDPIPAASSVPAEPVIKVGDNILLKGKQLVVTRIGTESTRLQGYKAVTLDAALKALADMRQNSASDSDSLSALDKFLQQFGFLPGAAVSTETTSEARMYDVVFYSVSNTYMSSPYRH